MASYLSRSDDGRGAPLVTISYATEEESKEAEAVVRKAIENASTKRLCLGKSSLSLGILEAHSDAGAVDPDRLVRFGLKLNSARISLAPLARLNYKFVDDLVAQFG